MHYVAANATATKREELLQLRVTDVAGYPEAEGEFEAMIAAGELIGRTTVRCKDGTKRSLHHRSGETRIAGLTDYVAVLWPDHQKV